MRDSDKWLLACVVLKLYTLVPTTILATHRPNYLMRSKKFGNVDFHCVVVGVKAEGNDDVLVSGQRGFLTR